MAFLEKVRKFISESRVELKKVVWPTREETVRNTLMVIIMSGVMALFLGALDFALQFILNKFVL